MAAGPARLPYTARRPAARLPCPASRGHDQRGSGVWGQHRAGHAAMRQQPPPPSQEAPPRIACPCRQSVARGSQPAVACPCVRLLGSSIVPG
eukprot:4202485-Alexandrium_andersonii.AAC.1